jgi:hypothetical protein
MLDRLVDQLGEAPPMSQAMGDLVQIIPADRWWALYQHNGRTERHPLIAWGLTDSGTVVGLVEATIPPP